MILHEEEIDGYECCKFQSTNIVFSKYSIEKQELIVTFIKGRTFKYTPVTYEMYLWFKTDESQGKYFVEHIQKNKTILFEKIG